MERYEYDKAVQAFRAVHELAPGWIAGSINLAIALLNQTGTEGAAAPAGSAGYGHGLPARFQEALALLDAVLARDPGNLSAHYCRGIILEDLGELGQAHQDFRFVTEHDPGDAHAWYRLGSTLTDPERPDRPAGPKQAGRLIEVYSKALELNPNLVNALYKLQAAYGWSGQRDRQVELIRRWQELDPKSNPAGPGDPAGTTYGEMGRYAQIISPIAGSRVVAGAGPVPQVFAPRDPDRDRAARGVPLGHGFRLRRPPRHHRPGAGPLRRGGRRLRRRRRRQARPLPLLRGERARGVRDALLINRGEGSFRDATGDFGLGDDRASLGVAAGDFDADGRIDLFLTGVGSNRLYRNLGTRFEDVTSRSGIAGPPAVSLTARWLDLDQDGDLDLYVVNHAAAQRVGRLLRRAAHPRACRTLRTATTASPRRSRAGRRPTGHPLAVASADLPRDVGAVDRVHALARRRCALRRSGAEYRDRGTRRRRRPRPRPGPLRRRQAAPRRPERPPRAVSRRRDARRGGARAPLRPARDRLRQGWPLRPGRGLRARIP